MTNFCLETRRLHKEYGGVVGVDELTFDVRPGEIVGLLGPNGAGKTTALRMIAAVLTPTSGTARVCGHDVIAEPMLAKRSLGFLSGATALYRRLTPREIMRYFGDLHEMNEPDLQRRMNELTESLGMQYYADRRCGVLSAGELQRANIARTLVHDPPLLVLDEPTTALDVISARFILQTIRRARDDGRAVLLSTHQMDEAELLCDRLVLLYKGQMRAVGTLDELRAATGRQTLTEVFLHFVDRPHEEEPCAGV